MAASLAMHCLVSRQTLTVMQVYTCRGVHKLWLVLSCIHNAPLATMADTEIPPMLKGSKGLSFRSPPNNLPS